MPDLLPQDRSITDLLALCGISHRRDGGYHERHELIREGVVIGRAHAHEACDLLTILADPMGAAIAAA